MLKVPVLMDLVYAVSVSCLFHFSVFVKVMNNQPCLNQNQNKSAIMSSSDFGLAKN